MSSKDKTQSHHQYKQRKKRLEIKKEYDDKLEKNSNEIKSIDDEIARLTLLKSEKTNERNEIKNEEFQKLASCYNNKAVIQEIVRLGRNTTFSRSVIDDIEKRCINGINIDDVNFDFLEKITLVDETINQQLSHTNIIWDIFSDFGCEIRFPGEEDEENGS